MTYFNIIKEWHSASAEEMLRVKTWLVQEDQLDVNADPSTLELDHKTIVVLGDNIYFSITKLGNFAVKSRYVITAKDELTLVPLASTLLKSGTPPLFLLRKNGLFLLGYPP
jgi:hypothetical protein